MTHSVWTDEQVINQLSTGRYWETSAISFAFPGAASGMVAEGGEDAGFIALAPDQKILAQIAIATWDELIGPALVFTSSSSSDIEYGYSSTGVEYAHAYFPLQGSVWFKAGDQDLVLPVVGSYGFGTYIHETGHALGLNHMGDYNGEGTWEPSSYQDSSVYSIMSYFGPNRGDGEGHVAWADWVAADGVTYSPQTPMMNDILAIQAIYGASSVRANNDIYGFGTNLVGTTSQIYNFIENINPIICIYDSGGDDTLDVSGWSTPSEISLLAESFSSCNSMTNNISIARGVTIENAATGSGNDRIIGNSSSNYLTAGAGNDTIVSGAGNDTVDGGIGTDYLELQQNRGELTVSYEVGASRYSLTLQSSPMESKTVSGIEEVIFADQTASLNDLVPSVFRFYNTTTGTHFYTGNKEEADHVFNELVGFNFEGGAFSMNLSGSGDAVNVHRFYNTATGTHFYSASQSEVDWVQTNLPTYQYEGVAYQAHSSSSDGLLPLYRFFNTQTGAHFYTANESEMQSVRLNLAGLLNFEGVAYFVDPV